MTPMEITRHIDMAEEGSYFLIPFDVPEGVERVDISYAYEHETVGENGGITARRSANIIDFFLLGPGEAFLGSSGSNRDRLWVSALGSSPGFAAVPTAAGRWHIGVGAYRVADGGVDVRYTVTFTAKRRRLFRGDTHVHTTASDGQLSLEGTVSLAQSMGLDFLFITDHNNHAQHRHAHDQTRLTVLPGAEWTHYRGHANLLGVPTPFRGSFHANSPAEAAAKLAEARTLGALVVVNHPFCPQCPWQWGFDMPFDAVEVWNGVMSERNVRAVLWWHEQLKAGRRLPVTGGSDYHRPGLLGSLAMPCMNLYAPSREPADLLAALRAGHGYISYLPDGPGVDADCEGAGLGDVTPANAPVCLRFFGLRGGDALRLLTDRGEETLVCPADTVEWSLERSFAGAKFCRFEVVRVYESGLPPMTAMLSNPIYFE